MLTRNADSFVTKVMKIKQDLADTSSELDEWLSRRKIRPEMGLNLDEDDGQSTISSSENQLIEKPYVIKESEAGRHD